MKPEAMSKLKKCGKNFQCIGSIDPLCGEIVTIGDNVVLGANSRIITHCPIIFYKKKKIETIVGNNVFIGWGCIILPGVKIGNNVIIGAGSVVSKDIPSGVIAAGNPCRVIRNMTETELKRNVLMIEQKKVGNGKEPIWPQ